MCCGRMEGERKTECGITAKEWWMQQKHQVAKARCPSAWPCAKSGRRNARMCWCLIHCWFGVMLNLAVTQFLLCVTKCLWWETTLKSMEGKNIGMRISGCESLKCNLALGIASNPCSLPSLSLCLWPNLVFHCFQLHRCKKSFEYCHMNRKVLVLQHIMFKQLLLYGRVNL